MGKEEDDNEEKENKRKKKTKTKGIVEYIYRQRRNGIRKREERK